MHTCPSCKNKDKFVGIIQKETRYYSLDLETNQMKDFHGDETVESQEYFCLNCNAKIKNMDK